MLALRDETAMALRFQTKPTRTRDDAHDEWPEPVVLDDASFNAFSSVMANPPRPNAKLRALFKK
jgi:hypothetical protein